MSMLEEEKGTNAKVRMIINLVYSVTDYHNFIEMMKRYIDYTKGNNSKRATDKLRDEISEATERRIADQIA